MKKCTDVLHPRGFSLAELMLVLLIMGLLAGGGSQLWQRWRYRQQQSETAAQLQVFLAGVREYALQTNRDLPLSVYPVTGSWCIDSRRPPQPSDCLRSGRFVWRAPYPQVGLLGVKGEPGFYGRRSTARAGSIEFGDSQQRWRLIISSQARIRICQPSQEGCT